MTDECCANCKFSRELFWVLSDSLECRRKSPEIMTVTPVGQEHLRGRAMWPVVSTLDRCGEFKPAS